MKHFLNTCSPESCAEIRRLVRHGLVWMAPPCASWSFMFLVSSTAVRWLLQFKARRLETRVCHSLLQPRSRGSTKRGRFRIRGSRAGAFAAQTCINMPFAGRRDLLSVDMANRLAVRLAYLCLASSRISRTHKTQSPHVCK